MARTLLKGTGAARGLAAGPARVLESRELDIVERYLRSEEIDAELARLRQAFARARAELSQTRERVGAVLAKELREVIEAHLLMLDDPELTSGTEDMVRIGHYAADWALKVQRDRLAALFDSLDDPYLRARRDDIDQVLSRVIRLLQRGDAPEGDLSRASPGEIIVADDIAPDEVSRLHEAGVAALVTERGGLLSHTTILARALKLPLVIRVAGLRESVSTGDPMLLDGISGEVLLHPDAIDLEQHERRCRELLAAEMQRTRLRSLPSRTRDGVDVRLLANTELAADLAQARHAGAEGIGLYRSEFLFLNRGTLPSEDEQYAAYVELIRGMDGRSVTVRTLDLGADKAPRTGIRLQGEANPALGLRGLRLCMAHPEIFRTQLRALLRAAALGPLRILVPMVSSLAEVHAVRAEIERCHTALAREGHALPSRVALGAMIEVPAAALAARSLLRALDFASIGTNDLIQYTMAVDRGTDALGHLYEPLQPAVLELIARVIEAGRRWRKPVAMCGEMAANPAYTRLLLALGLREFSVHPASLLEVKSAIRDTELGRLRHWPRRLLAARDAAQVARLIGL